jgi:RND family efflux transporter MFP subunit
MKTVKKTLIIIIILAIAGLIAFKLISNKKQLNAELKAVTDFNTVIPVITDTVKSEYPNDVFNVKGSFLPSHEVSVVSETQGKVSAILVDIGDRVAANQSLVSVENDLVSAQLKLAKANFEKAEKDKKRYDLLSNDNAVTVQQKEVAELAYTSSQSALVTVQKEYDNSVIKAPISGIVTSKSIEVGSFLTPAIPVFSIVDISNVILKAMLTADEVSKVKIGQVVNVSVDEYPGASYDGKIKSIDVNADLSKKYYVEVEVLNNSDKLIKPGMYGSVSFGLSSKNLSLVIPRRSVIGSIISPQVFIVQGDSAILKNITVVPLDDNNLSVIKGLNSGDIIIVSGQINLKNGTKIKVLH